MEGLIQNHFIFRAVAADVKYFTVKACQFSLDSMCGVENHRVISAFVILAWTSTNAFASAGALNEIIAINCIALKHARIGLAPANADVLFFCRPMHTVIVLSVVQNIKALTKRALASRTAIRAVLAARTVRSTASKFSDTHVLAALIGTSSLTCRKVSKAFFVALVCNCLILTQIITRTLVVGKTWAYRKKNWQTQTC